MKRLIETKLRDERASAIIENVIVLPIIFVVILSLIMTAFIIHERSAVEAAAKRGAIYAAHCIADPNYAALVGQNGELDLGENVNVSNFTFSGVGKNIDMYRYLFGGDDISSQVEAEVTKILEKTRISWRDQEAVEVSYSQQNHLLYQTAVVEVTAHYAIPDVFGFFGLETDFEYTVVATVAATDPDEFIRNADMIVDLVTDIDEATGGNISKVLDKVGTLSTKLLSWFSVE